MDTTADMVMMKAGQMIMLIDGEMLYMEEDVFTSDGTQVKPDGTMIASDGTISMLSEDEAVIINRALSGGEVRTPVRVCDQYKRKNDPLSRYASLPCCVF